MNKTIDNEISTRPEVGKQTRYMHPYLIKDIKSYDKSTLVAHSDLDAFSAITSSTQCCHFLKMYGQDEYETVLDKARILLELEEIVDCVTVECACTINGGRVFRPIILVCDKICKHYSLWESGENIACFLDSLDVKE